MTRAQAALLFGTAAIVAIIAGIVTAIVIAGGDGGDSSTHDLSNDLTAIFDPSVEVITPLPQPTAEADDGAFFPDDIPAGTALTFCEPMPMPGGMLGLATVPGRGLDVVYVDGTCKAEVDPQGFVSLRSADGSIEKIAPTAVPRDSFPAPNDIVWMPASGELDGVPTAMTAEFLTDDAELRFDISNNPVVIFSMTSDGRQVFGSLTERIIDLPLATFIGVTPLRGRSGQIIAATVEARIDDTAATTGLSQVDARRLVEFINSGSN